MIDEDYGISEGDTAGRLIAMNKKTNEFSKSNSDSNDDVIGLLDVNLDKDDFVKHVKEKSFENLTKSDEVVDLRNNTNSDQLLIQNTIENVPVAKDLSENMTNIDDKNDPTGASENVPVAKDSSESSIANVSTDTSENVPVAKDLLGYATNRIDKNDSTQGLRAILSYNHTEKINVLEHRNITNDSDQLLLRDTHEDAQIAKDSLENASESNDKDDTSAQSVNEKKNIDELAQRNKTKSDQLLVQTTYGNAQIAKESLENASESNDKDGTPAQSLNENKTFDELTLSNKTKSDQLLVQTTHGNAQIAKESLDDVTESDDAINGDSDVYMEHMDREDDFPDVIANEAVSEQTINEKTSIEVMKNHTGLPDIPNESFTTDKAITAENIDHQTSSDTIGRNRVFAYQNKTKNGLHKKDDSYVFTDSESYTDHDDTNHALQNINTTMRMQHEKGFPKLENSSVLSQDFPSFLRNSTDLDEDLMSEKETNSTLNSAYTTNTTNTTNTVSAAVNKTNSQNYTTFTNSLTDIIMQVLGEGEAKPSRAGIFKKVKDMQEERSNYESAKKFSNDNGTMEDVYPNSPFPENIEESVYQTDTTDFDKDARATVHTNVGDIFVLFHSSNQSHTKTPMVENANESLVTVRTKFGTIDFDFHGLHKKDQTSQNRAHIFGKDVNVIPKNFDFKDRTHRYVKRKQSSHASVPSYNDFKKAGTGKRKNVSEVIKNMSSMLQNISKISEQRDDKNVKNSAKKNKGGKQSKETKFHHKASPKINLYEINLTTTSSKQKANDKAKKQNSKKTAYQKTNPKSTYRYKPNLVQNRPLPSYGSRFRNLSDWTFPYNYIEKVSKFYDTIEPPPMLISPSEKTQESMRNVSLNYQASDPDEDEYNNWGVYNFKQHVSDSGTFMSGPANIPDPVIPIDMGNKKET